MMRSNISRLAVLGLAAISSQVFAAVSLSGQVRLDTKFVSEPKTGADSDDSMAMSRVRLNLKGDVASDWVAGARLEGSSNTVVLDRAFATWTGLENHSITLGKACHHGVDADYNYHAPYTSWQNNGTLAGFGAIDSVGASIAGSMGAFGYSLGLSNVNVNGGDDESLDFSVAARGHFTAMNSDSMAWGVGIGYINEKMPEWTFILADTDYVTDTNEDLNTSTTTKSKKYDGMTLDISGVMGKFAMTAALYTAKNKFASVDTPLANNPFEKDGKANSYYLEGTYLVMGDSYGFRNAVVSGPKFKSSALEIGARFSRTVKKNLSAVSDLTPDAAGASTTDGVVQTSAGLTTTLGYDMTSVGLDATSELKLTTNTTSVFANYHVNPNAVVKVEYYNSSMKDKRTNLGTAQADVKKKHLSIRAQFSF